MEKMETLKVKLVTSHRETGSDATNVAAEVYFSCVILKITTRFLAVSLTAH